MVCPMDMQGKQNPLQMSLILMNQRKPLPHQSPKKHTNFKGAIVLSLDEAAVLAESGEIGLVSLKDKEATMKR